MRLLHFHFLTLVVLTVSASAAHSDQPDVPSFRNQIMAVLSKAGCNQGSCHGNANGKGGLKLSLRGQNPDEDYFTLTRRSDSRLVTTLTPEKSLLLQKPSMAIPHEGGQRFTAESQEYSLLRKWITGGMPKDKDTAPSLLLLKVSPEHQTVYAPVRNVSLKAVATFTDGTTRDVTSLVVFDSSATFVSVSSDGVATAEQPGMTTVTVRYLNQQRPVRLEFVPEQEESTVAVREALHPIDAAVFAQLKRLRLNPTPVCDDTTFLRRVTLDVTGQLPPPEQARAFLASTDSRKREKLIDEVLRSDAFNDFQALRWSDLLRVEDKTLDSKGVEVFYDWIRKSFAENKPLNQFAAEIISARGSTYKIPPTNFYRALRKPEDRAESVAQVFLGIRLQCARCHNHPFDRWTQDDYYGWSNFFGRIEYEIIENKRRDKNDKNEFVGEQIVKMKSTGEVVNPNTGQSVSPRFLGSQSFGGIAETELVQDVSQLLSNLGVKGQGDHEKPDRLQQLAAWLGDAGNERFAVTQANRIWFQLIGRGVIDPVDDFRSTNPPTNPELLEVLQKEFVDHQFDVRHLMRFIMTSQTYQLASENRDHVTSISDHETTSAWAGCFFRTEIRRLTAEQTLDAISSVMNLPVKFGGHPSGTKAVQLKGVRNGGHRYSVPEVGDRFLKLFGKPNRLLTCDCERSAETTLAQTFEMVSGELISHLMARSGNRIDQCIREKLSDEAAVEQFYLAALSRLPTAEELKAATNHIAGQKQRRSGLEDVVWALVNSNEFLLRR